MNAIDFDLLDGPDPEVFSYTYEVGTHNGRRVRRATGVRFADGHTIRFLSTMSDRDAIAHGWRCRAEGCGDES